MVVPPRGDYASVPLNEEGRRVDDPQYLTEEFVTSTSFKRLEDGSSWRPEPCESG